MNRLDEPRPLNTDALLDTIYRIQADLKILVDQLARSRNPDLADHAVIDLAVMAHLLQRHAPSLRRH